MSIRGNARGAMTRKEGDQTENYEAKIKVLSKLIDDLVGRSSLVGETEEERNEFSRKRNALYSQRKYYRKKICIEELEKRRDHLIAMNANVREQNEVLEQTLNWAVERVNDFEILGARSPATAASSGSDSSLRGVTRAAQGLPTTTYTLLDLLHAEQADRLQQLVANQGLRALGPNLTGRLHVLGSDDSVLRGLGTPLLTPSAYLASVGSQLPNLSSSALSDSQQRTQQSELLHLQSLQRSAGLRGPNFSSFERPQATARSLLLQHLLGVQASNGDISGQLFLDPFLLRKVNSVRGSSTRTPKTAPVLKAAAVTQASLARTASSAEEEDRKLPAITLPPRRRDF